MRLSIAYLLPALFSLALACAGKGDDTGSTEQATTEQTGPATGGPVTTGDTTHAPTTEGCLDADACGIGVDMGTAVCDHADGVQASTGGVEPPSLTATSLGGGKVAVHETGHDATCCLTLVPQIAVDGATITVTYVDTGDPCDCVCTYTIDFTLLAVPSGTWTIVSGALSTDVTVP